MRSIFERAAKGGRENGGRGIELGLTVKIDGDTAGAEKRCQGAVMVLDAFG